jgi:hypothetical protein
MAAGNTEEGTREGGAQFSPTLGSPVSPAGAIRSSEGLPSLTAQATAAVVCSWCIKTITEGTVPVTHGICGPCEAKFRVEAQAILDRADEVERSVNPHNDTSDREEPEELLPARPSDEFASRQRPDGGW